MPIYEYECALCHQHFERLQRLTDPVLSVCPMCGGAVHKKFSVPALQFKGSGFYVTDYGRRTSGSVASESKSSPAKESKASGGSDAN